MSLEAIGRQVGKHPSTVSYWLKKHGLKPLGVSHGMRHPAIAEDDLREMVAAGLTLAEIADNLGRSVSSVRYWIDRFQIENKNKRGPRRREARGARTARFRCRRHGLTDFRLEGRGTYRCMLCRSAAVSKRRRVVKSKLVREAGGRCILCGYERCPGALHFHHVDPATKEFHLSESGHSRALARARVEIGKCVLLCANCHAEVEAGFASLPGDSEATVTAGSAL